MKRKGRYWWRYYNQDEEVKPWSLRQKLLFLIVATIIIGRICYVLEMGY